MSPSERSLVSASQITAAFGEFRESFDVQHTTHTASVGTAAGARFQCLAVSAMAALLASCGRLPNHPAPTPSGVSEAQDPPFGTVGKDGLFHPGPALKAQIVKEDAQPTISEGDALSHCARALGKRLGRKPNLTLQDHFPDGGRFFVEGEPGSEASRTNCFVEKSGAIANLRVNGIVRR